MNTTVNIKIKPYLKEFIIYQCNTNPAKISKRDAFGVMLEGLLERPPIVTGKR